MKIHCNISLSYLIKIFSIAALVCCALACGPRPAPGPDQAVSGGLAGATIGAGAGMVIGNQVSHIGPGAAVGAGFGLLAGALTGHGEDRLEETNFEMKNELAALRASSSFNRQRMEELQDQYDNSTNTELPLQSYQVFFDDNATNLKSGAIAELEQIAEAIKISRAAIKIEIAGHTDESGSPQYNMQLSEARARNTASYLQGRGISVDSFEIKSFGSSRPIATNSTPEGRQLNRRVEIRVLK